MATLVDTTIRLLSQEPLAARVSSSRLLEVAELLDRAGFAALEVSGGGCFDAAVRRGVESPWERIRALRDRCETPLGMALRGRFLVGSRPVTGDLVRHFIRSASDNGIDVFRIHDPLNDLANLSEAAEAIHSCAARAGDRARAQPGPGRRDRRAARAGRAPERARAGARPDPRPGRLARSRRRARAGRAGRRRERAAGRPPRAGRGRRGARGRDRERARRRRPRRVRDLSRRALALSGLRGGGDEVARRDRLRHGSQRRPPLGGVRARGRGARRRACRPARAARCRARRRAQPSGRPRRGARRPPARAGRVGPPRRRARRADRDPSRDRVAAAGLADRSDARLAGAHPRPLGAALADRRGRAPRPARGAVGDAARRGRPERRARCRAARPGRRARGGGAGRAWTTCARTPRASPRARRSCSFWRCSRAMPRGCCARSARAGAARRPRAPRSAAASPSGCAS